MGTLGSSRLAVAASSVRQVGSITLIPPGLRWNGGYWEKVCQVWFLYTRLRHGIRHWLESHSACVHSPGPALPLHGLNNTKQHLAGFGMAYTQFQSLFFFHLVPVPACLCTGKNCMIFTNCKFKCIWHSCPGVTGIRQEVPISLPEHSTVHCI